MGHQPKAAFHGFGVARGVKHHVKKLAACQGSQLRLVIGTEAHAMADAQGFCAKVQPVLAAVECGDGGAAQLRKNHGRHADGPGAHHQHALPRAQA